MDRTWNRPEQEREVNMGKREEVQKPHQPLNRNEEGRKDQANFLEEFRSPELLSISTVLNFLSSFQRDKKQRKTRISLLPSLPLALPTRGPHFLDVTICNCTHSQARYRVHRRHTDECRLFCPAFPSFAAVQVCQKEADLLAAADCWPAGIRICSHFGHPQCQLRHITPTADLWT